MTSPSFTVYSKNGCPFCTKVIAALQLAELTFVEYKLDRDYKKSEFYAEFGPGSTFPQVLSNGQKLGGCQETVKYLRENSLV